MEEIWKNMVKTVPNSVKNCAKLGFEFVTEA